VNSNGSARIVTPDVIAAIEAVTDYTWLSEEADYGQQDLPDRAGHIFNDLTVIRTWLDQADSLKPILETFGSDPNTYTLDRHYRHGAWTFRVKVVRDYYPHQSWATVKAFKADGVSIDIIDYPPSNWHRNTPRCDDRFGPKSFEPGFAALARVADELAAQAVLILPV